MQLSTVLARLITIPFAGIMRLDFLQYKQYPHILHRKMMGVRQNVTTVTGCGLILYLILRAKTIRNVHYTVGTINKWTPGDSFHKFQFHSWHYQYRK